MRNFFSILVCVFIALFSLNTYAWNAVGHMVIATIAYNQLQPNVKAKVDVLVGNFSKEYPEVNSFVLMAPWPDTLRKQSIETFTNWHFVNMPYSLDGVATIPAGNSDNVVWAINKIKPILMNKKTNAFEKARFLTFFVHFVGDVHQPLHGVQGFSKDYPEGDQGGNLYDIEYQFKKYEVDNLHSLWDGGVGIFDAPVDIQTITTIANMITSLYPAESFKDQVADLDPQHWANEDLALAPTIYNTPQEAVPSNDYIAAGQKIAGQRAALASYRLAAELNLLLGDVK